MALTEMLGRAKVILCHIDSVFALVHMVVLDAAHHARLYRCLPDAGRSNFELLLLIVGHTGVLGLDNAQALLDLGVPASQVQPALEAIAVMGCTRRHTGAGLTTLSSIHSWTFPTTP